MALIRRDGSMSSVAGTAVPVIAAAGDRPTTPPGSTAPPASGEGEPVIAWLVLAALVVVLVGAIAWQAVREL